MKVAISSTRYFIGTFMSYDKHMNIVLADCCEYRITTKGELKRQLGLIILRGENVLSVTPESPPLPPPKIPQFKAAPQQSTITKTRQQQPQSNLSTLI
jgi:small nuclear ribonucleoprotein B and B'